jgi:soluble cytochrome b562
MANKSIVEVLIENFKKDQEQLEESQKKIDEAKEAKREITDRMKDYRKDLSVLLKYADEEQVKKIQELGFDLTGASVGLNKVASIALDIIMKAKGNKMSNGALHSAYVESLENKESAVNYTEFNIKCRSLFNSQRLIRLEGKDPQSSRDHIIKLNGRVIPNNQN